MTGAERFTAPQHPYTRTLLAAGKTPPQMTGEAVRHPQSVEAAP